MHLIPHPSPAMSSVKRSKLPAVANVVSTRLVRGDYFSHVMQGSFIAVNDNPCYEASAWRLLPIELQQIIFRYLPPALKLLILGRLFQLKSSPLRGSYHSSFGVPPSHCLFLQSIASLYNMASVSTVGGIRASNYSLQAFSNPNHAPLPQRVVLQG